MSAKEVFESIGALEAAREGVLAIAPGLRDFKGNMGEAGAELSRLGTQGSMELASVLFNGSSFVPYGPGAYLPSVEPQTQEMGGQERGGMER